MKLSRLFFAAGFVFALALKAYAQPAVVSVTDVRNECAGAVNGSLVITVTSGTGPFSYFMFGIGFGDIKTGALTLGTPVTVTGLRADNYLLTVLDGDPGANFSTFVPITNVTPNITATVSSQQNNTDNTCTSPNGSISVNVSGGSGSYTYSWTSTNGFTSSSEDITNLLGGTYQLVVGDQNANCSFTLSNVVLTDPLPNQFTLTSPSSAVCSGQGITLNLSDTDPGVTYTVLVNGTATTTTFLGDGNPASIVFSGPPTLATGQTITIRGVLGICAPVTMSGSINVTVNPLPASFNVTGGGALCTGGTPLSIGLSGSEVGVNYTLVRDGATNVETIPGSGSALSFTAQSAAGTYTVVAQNATTGCQANMSGSVAVVVNPLPATFNVSGGGSLCAGGAGVAVGLNGSENGVNYTLVRDGATNVETIPGTGAALAFTAQATAGTYTVVAVNATTSCQQAMTGNAVVVVNPLPTAFNVSGGGSYCAGSPVAQAIALSGSQTGVDYTLVRDGVTNVETIPGTGAALAFTAQTTPGTYTVVARNTTTLCQSTMNANAVISINPLPTVFNVTGGGSYCTGSVVAQAIGLSGSEVGVNYTLVRDGATNVQTLSGTGSALAFTAQTTPGTYTVVAQNATTACQSNMAANAVVSVDPLPTVFNVTGGGSLCAGGAGVSIGLSGSQVGVNYNLIRDGVTNVETVAGTGAALAFTAQSVAGTYTVVAVNGTTSCQQAMTGNAVVVVNPLPTAFNVTGGGSYCAGSPTGIAVGLSGSQTGVNYTLIRDGVTNVQTVAGTGGALAFTAQTTPGTYTVRAVNATTSCQQDMTGNASIVVNPLPAVFSVTGGGSYCAGSPTPVAVGLSGSEVGVNYTLVRNGTTNVETIAGTGAAIAFTAQTVAGTYTVTAQNSTTACQVSMTGSAAVTIDPLPAAFNVTGGGSYCAGTPVAQAIGLSGSAAGINYTLVRDGVTNVETIAGTGAALAFTAQTTPGTYTVVAVNATTTCQAPMTGNAVVSVSPVPNSFNVTGGGALCAGATGVAVGLSGSETGVNYTLVRDGVTNVQTVAGTGAALAFTAQTTAGTYTVVAQNATTSCQANMTGNAVVVVNPLPATFTVTGGGNYCSGSPAGQAIGLSGSEIGVNYTLVLNGSTNVETIPGTGAALAFTPQTTAGTYTVSAQNATTSCQASMTGSAVVTVNPLPTAFNTTGGGSLCTGGAAVAIGLSGSQTGVNYTLVRDGVTNVETIAGTGAALAFTAQSTAGTYTVVAQNATTSCQQAMTGNAVVVVNPLPAVFTVSGGGQYCSGTVVAQAITLSGSEVGVNYTLVRNGSTNVETIAGTGAVLNFTAQSTPGTYTVVATNATTSCTAPMTASADVVANPLPTAFNVTGGGSLCTGGAPVAIGLSGSEVGVNYTLVRDGATNVETIAGTGAALAFTTQTTAGTYTVVAQNATTTCQQNMTGSAAVVVNPLPNVFNVTGGGTICTGGTPLSISLSGSETGVNYTLVRDGATNVETVAGTGAALNFTAQSTAGTYTVVAVNATTTCQANMTGNAVVIVNPLPASFNVTGGGSYCAGTPIAQAIGLSGSEAGVNYTLVLNGTTNVETIAGTGAAISFTAQTTAGAYTVVAQNATTSCQSPMTGSVNVTINPLPAAFDVAGGGTICSGAAGLSITLSGSETGVNYTLVRDGATNVETTAGTGAALSFTAQTTAGTYTVVAANATTTCQQNMNGSAAIVVAPLPAIFNVSGGGTICAGDPGLVVALSGSETGVNYSLVRNGSINVETIAGTGSALNFTAQTTAGTYTIVAQNATTLCTAPMTGNAVINVNALPTATITGTTSVCSGTSANITVTFTGTGPWSFRYSDGTTTSPAIPSFFNSITFPVTPTATTTYTLVSVNDANCTGTVSGSAVVTVNTAPNAAVTVTATPSPVCSGGSADVTIASEAGVSYQLRNDSNDANIGTPVVGTGAAIILPTGPLTATTTFNVLATATGCPAVELTTTPTVAVAGSINASLVVNLQDAAICSGNSTNVRVLASENGVLYQLRNDADNSAIGTAVAGTGGTIDLPTGALTATTTFNILASNGTCSIQLVETETVTVDQTPNLGLAAAPEIAALCSGGSTNIVVTGSQNGFTYQLRNDADDSNVGTAVTGTGGDILLPTGVLTASTTFNILVSSGGACGGGELVAKPVVNVSGTINAGLAVAAVSNPVCTGSTASIVITNAEAGVTYQLRDDATNAAVGASAVGTGANLTLTTPALTASVTLNVFASNATCSIELTNTVTVNVDVNPDASLTVNAAIVNLCSGGNTTIDVVNSQVGVSYQLRNDADDSTIGTPVTGTGGTISLPTGTLTATTTFNVLASSGVCAAVELTTRPIVNVGGTLNAALTVSATAGTICAGSSTFIQLAASENGVTYQLRDNATNANVGTSQTGNGGTLNFPTGNITTTTTYQILASNGTCSIVLTDTETITVNPAPNLSLAVTASPNPVCNNTAAIITIANAENGVTYQLRDASNTVLSTSVGTGANLTFSTGNLTANATFNVFASVGTCSGQLTNTVTVTVRAIGDPACGGGGGTGSCATVVITPRPRAAQCTLSNGRISFNIVPFTPAVNNVGVIINIDGVSVTNQTIARTQYNDSVFTALPIGTYDYTIVYGDSSCIKTGQVTIDQSGTVGVPIASNVVDPICFGSSTGAVTIDVPGETGNPLEWSYDGGITDPFKPFVAGSQITGIPAGPAPTFERVISIRRNISDPCYASVRIVIQDDNPQINATYTLTQATCAGNDGAIRNIVPSGGSGSTFTYSLDGVNYQTTNEFTGLAAGNYSLRVRDQVNCERQFDFIISFPGFIASVVTPVDANCSNNGLSGSINVQIPAPGIYEVALSTDQFNEPADAEYVNYSNPSVNFTGLVRGQYFVYIRSTTSICPTRSAPIDINGSYAVDFELQPSCVGTDVSFSLVNITGEPGRPFDIIVYRKFTSEVVQAISLGSIPVTGSVLLDKALYSFLQLPDEYQIQIQQGQSIGCQIDSELKDLLVPEPLTALAIGTKESFPDIANGEIFVNGFRGGYFPYQVRIELDSVSSQLFPSYETDFEQVERNSSSNELEKLYSNIPPGRYIVQVTDDLGCGIELTARVRMNKDVFVPNVFSPNGDDINDVFYIRNLPSDNSKLIITNRWGKEVYSSNSYQNNWSGGGTPDGLYFYTLRIEGMEPLTGWVEIIRGKAP